MRQRINVHLKMLNDIYNEKKEVFVFYIKRYLGASAANEYLKAFERLHLSEVKLLESIRNEFKEANKKIKSIENIINIHTYEFKKEAMVEYLHIDAEQPLELEIEIKNISRLLSKEKYRLKNLITKLSTEEIQVISSIRSNSLRTQINNSEFKLSQYKNEIKNIQDLLKKVNSSLPKYENLNIKYNLLRKKFLNEQQKNKLNIEEMQYWQVLEKIPTRSLEKFYKIGA